MADDWDTVTKIGSKARGGVSQRETVVRGKSALNAAQRSGIITSTEKKMGAGNSASKPGVEGQHLTKVDRSDDIVPVKKPDAKVADAIQKRRQVLNLTQKDLAAKCNVKQSDISDVEGAKVIPDNKLAPKLERILQLHVRGPKGGKPLREPDDEKAKTEKAKTKKSGK